jgi:[ribosomal protein S18]-alanine N-acetyltransferase
MTADSLSPLLPRLIDVGVAHVPLLSALHGACFEDGWRPQTFHSLIHAGGVFGFLAMDGRERPLGFALCRITVGEGEILTLGVLREARQRGVGKLLLSGVCARLAAFGGHVLFLEVAESNKPATGLYDSFGFQQVGKRKDYYTHLDGSREAALVMRRDLLG